MTHLKLFGMFSDNNASSKPAYSVVQEPHALCDEAKGGKSRQLRHLENMCIVSLTFYDLTSNFK